MTNNGQSPFLQFAYKQTRAGNWKTKLSMKTYILILLGCAFNITVASGIGPEILLTGKADPKAIFQDEKQMFVINSLAKADYASVGVAIKSMKIDKRGVKGVTLLWWQANVGNFEAFEYLLNMGANPSAQTSDGPNVIELCAMQEDIRFIKAAVKNGANVNLISQYDRQTPIFSAVLSRRFENAKFILDAGACLDVADPMGTTPVLLASDQGAFDFVVFFLKRGANPFFKTIQGHDLIASLKNARVEADSLADTNLILARKLVQESQAKCRAEDVIP